MQVFLDLVLIPDIIPQSDKSHRHKVGKNRREDTCITTNNKEQISQNIQIRIIEPIKIFLQ